MTAIALIYYAVGLWAVSGVRIIVSAFYALQDTVTPVKVSVVTFLAYLFFGLILMGPLKHGGLALALSLSSSINFMLLIFLLKRKIPQWSLTPIIVSILKTLLSAVIMGLGVYCLKYLLFPDNPDARVFKLVIEVVILVVSGLIIYLLAAFLFRCRELGAFSRLIKKRI